MWRSIWCVVLLPTLLFSQALETVNPNPAIPQAQLSLEPLRIHHFTYYSEVRRGRNEKAALEVALTADHCCTSLPATVPLSLELERTDGFTVSKFEYPKTYEHITPPYGANNVREANGGTIKFRLQVDREVGLGKHILKGRLRFQVVTEKGARAAQETDIESPLTVVEHNAKVTKSWPYHWDPSNKELILLLPVIIIFVVFQSVRCAAGTGCSS